mmetsp:Transcript_90655/g.174539  ORF Transcript_90655/g.174539 Transcript_90655/m.174539 type:complete len:203 (+) Transcript_90655:722-1330(+)
MVSSRSSNIAASSISSPPGPPTSPAATSRPFSSGVPKTALFALIPVTTRRLNFPSSSGKHGPGTAMQVTSGICDTSITQSFIKIGPPSFTLIHCCCHHGIVSSAAAAFFKSATVQPSRTCMLQSSSAFIFRTFRTEWPLAVDVFASFLSLVSSASRYFATSSCPFSWATSSAVLPSFVNKSTSAVYCSSSFLTAAMSPQYAA